ncbi:beta-lactamase-like protein [Camillea tinctor]|nr:beta-lactamase-like protein [Camillea tinctor]
MTALSSTPRNGTGSWLICTACGTQFPTSDRAAQQTCFICDDPRQFAPPTGQAFTTLDELRAPGSGYRNEFAPLFSSSNKEKGEEGKETFTSIYTVPKFAIGQRAILVRTPAGNILWDCLSLLDNATIAEITSRGGLDAIVISHPHYYTTHLDWARAFGCPVYLASEDAAWLTQTSALSQELVPRESIEYDVPGRGGVPSGFKVLKLGGHFPGSGVGLYEGRLLVADTLVTTPAGMGGYAAQGRGRPKGMNSYAFMWSIPNMIPLPPWELARMWRILQRHRFRSTHGAFMGLDIVGESEEEMQRRVLESMQIQVKHSGYRDHPLLRETVL